MEFDYINLTPNVVFMSTRGLTLSAVSIQREDHLSDKMLSIFSIHLELIMASFPCKAN
jgi:hypothetical protein